MCINYISPKLFNIIVDEQMQAVNPIETAICILSRKKKNCYLDYLTETPTFVFPLCRCALTHN